MAKRLTDTGIEKLSVKRRTYVTWDAATTGLGIKVTRLGKKIWIAQLRYPGCKAQSKRTLGLFPEMGVATARAKARLWYSQVKGGTDPADAEKKEREVKEAAQRAAALRDRNTFIAFAEKYIAERTNRRAKKDADEIRRDLVPVLGPSPIHEITPRDCRELFDDLKKRTPYGARNAWGHAVSIFKAAVHEELITASPLASLDKKQVFKNVRLQHRQRVLTNDELFAFWRATGRMGYPGGDYYRLLLLTATRRNELLDAASEELHAEVRRLIREAKKTNKPVRWAAVAPEVKTLTVPRERFKSDSDHVVCLTDDALAIIEKLPRLGPFLFASPVKEDASLWLGSKHKKRLDARMRRTLRALASRRGDDPKAVKLPRWVSHDLRRVVRSQLSALDVDDHVAEMVLGHGRKGLQRIYDMHRFLPQIRAALEKWAAHLRTIVGPAPPVPDDRVVPLRGRGRGR